MPISGHAENKTLQPLCSNDKNVPRLRLRYIDCVSVATPTYRAQAGTELALSVIKQGFHFDYKFVSPSKV